MSEKGIHVCFVVEEREGRGAPPPSQHLLLLLPFCSDPTAANASLVPLSLSMAIKTSIMYHVTVSGKITSEGGDGECRRILATWSLSRRRRVTEPHRATEGEIARASSSVLAFLPVISADGPIFPDFLIVRCENPTLPPPPTSLAILGLHCPGFSGRKEERADKSTKINTYLLMLALSCSHCGGVGDRANV